MIKLTSESPVGDIIARYRALTGSTSDDKTLAKRGKGKLLAAIEQAVAKLEEQPEASEQKVEEILEPSIAQKLVDLHTEAAAKFKKDEEPEPAADAPQPLPVTDDGHKPIKPAKAKKEKKAKAKKEKKEKGPVIRAEAEKLLLKVVSHDKEKRAFGMPYEEILVELAKIFPEAKTTVACLRWYAVHMRERGEKVPARPRATKQAEAA